MTPKSGRVTGRILALAIGAALRSLRWRIGGGRWHAAAVDGAYAHLRAPVVGGARILHLDGRFRRDGGVRVEVPVVPLH